MSEESRTGGDTENNMVTPSLGLLVLLVVCLGVPPTIFFLVESPPPAPLYWDFANVLGYVAAGLFIGLFIYNGQRRRFPPFSGRFFIRLHHHLGYAVMVLVLMHIGVFLLREEYIIEHLKVTAPGYMLAGLVATILVALITLTSIQAIRRRIWKNYTLFRFLHALLGIAILFFTAWHIVGSAWYANTGWKLLVWLVATAIAYSVYLSGKYRRQAFDIPPIGRTRRPAALISYLSATILCCLAVVIALLLQRMSG